VCQAPASRDLAHLVGSLQQFQEDTFGLKSASVPSSSLPIPRIPAKLFKDFRPTGSVFAILLICYEYKEAQQWRRFDLASPSKKDSNIELFCHLEQKLLAQGLIRYPRLFFSPTVDEGTKQILRPLLPRMKATEQADPAGATHVIFPAPSAAVASQEDEDWFRTLEKTDKRALVHWWYFPDSYDEWVPLNELTTGEPEPPPNHANAWKVTARWVQDSIKFNEWMNEEDYELETDPDATSNSLPQVADHSKKRSAHAAGSPATQFGEESLSKRAKISSMLNDDGPQSQANAAEVLSLMFFILFFKYFFFMKSFFRFLSFTLFDGITQLRSL